jgi:thioesterase domain-containing protein
MNKTLDVDVPLVDLFQNPTIEELSGIVRRSTRARQTFASPVVAMQSRRTEKRNGAPIFYVHPLGGFAFCYLDLARSLAPNHLFYGLQSPAVELNESGILWTVGSIESLAARYIDAIKEVEPQGPYHLGGWSFGGTVAFEMARQLQERGDWVSSLVLMDTTFYNLQTENIRTHWPEESLGMAHENEDDAELLAHLYFGDERLPNPASPDETTEQRMENLLHRARLLNVIPPEADIPWGRRVATMVRDHRAAARRYAPSAYQGRIFFFKPLESKLLESADAHPSNGLSGLETLATEGVEIRFVPGDHLSMTFGEGAVAVSKWFLERFSPSNERAPDTEEEKISSALASVAHTLS